MQWPVLLYGWGVPKGGGVPHATVLSVTHRPKPDPLQKDPHPNLGQTGSVQTRASYGVRTIWPSVVDPRRADSSEI